MWVGRVEDDPLDLLWAARAEYDAAKYITPNINCIEQFQASCRQTNSRWRCSQISFVLGDLSGVDLNFADL